MQSTFSDWFSQFTQTQLIVAAILLVVVIAFAVGVLLSLRKRRTRALRTRFGSEYDRAVVTHGSSRDAEAKLSDRQSRVEALPIRELSITERERFSSEWQVVQSRFVDHPRAAVTEANDLINALLEARGYPMAGFEQRAADVSVTYPRVMENYRIAHGIAVRKTGAEATTEELRTAMIQYRSIFDELAQAQKPVASRSAA
jgi:uncharacterized SAM-binding protein YcdF (DUF218 family)